MNKSGFSGKIRFSFFCSYFLSFSFIFLVTCGVGAGFAKEQAIKHIPIPLLDEDGSHVLDTNKPYSSRQSCGNGNGSGCHNYDAMTNAYHFKMGQDEASDSFGKKRGLPHLVSPGLFGGYACMGGSNPDVLAKKTNASEGDFADRGAAGWVQRCNGCHPGGGWAEKDRTGTRYDKKDLQTVTSLDGDYYNRGTTEFNEPTTTDVVSMWDWKKSGVIEADCFICHADFSKFKKFDTQLGLDDLSDNTSSAYDHYRALRGSYLDTGGYFRYMGTAILEFLNLNDTADSAFDASAVVFGKTLGATSVHASAKPAYSLNMDVSGQPSLSWNSSAFDANRKVTIPMLRFPNNDNCMLCHLTSNSRRGFYGFGDNAEPVYDANGIMVENYKYDIHKGKVWAEANGVAKTMDNCNSCHSRNYYKSAYENIQIDADHNFPKGNSDMDAMNFLDYRPNALSCMYCHNDATNPSIPSGQADMLSAHTERWKLSGYLAGYPQEALTRITKTHLNTVSCQTCHITDKKGRRGANLQIMYRYRIEEDGKKRIIPYNPRIRYYWKDKTSEHILNKTERDAVFELQTDSNGKKIGAIKDPLSSEILGTVSVRFSHGAWRFGEPGTYEATLAVKKAYDNLLVSKGFQSPDTAMVWIESNQYVMNHNTRAAVSSLQCANCHNTKQGGAFSSLLSPSGLLGSGNKKIITTLADKKLVDDGVVVLGLPYMKVDDAGEVTENSSDILFATKIDPSLTILKSAKAKSRKLRARRMAKAAAILEGGVLDSAIVAKLKQFFSAPQNVYLFKSNYGDDSLKNSFVMVGANGVLGTGSLSNYMVETTLADDSTTLQASASGLGGLTSKVFSFSAADDFGNTVGFFGSNGVIIKIPYEGTNINLDEVKVITSASGSTWSAVKKESVIAIKPASDGTDGYLLFNTQHFSDYAVSDFTQQSSTLAPSSGSSGGGGCFIATAAYGSYQEPHVKVLRKFRDKILLTNRIGTALVEQYYLYSPSPASWLSKHDFVRAITRVLLIPLYGVAYFMVELSLAQQLVLMILMLGGCFFLVSKMKKDGLVTHP